jgi:hypothetical protein
MFQAFILGLCDGCAQPDDLTSGLTWPDDQDNNEAYDHGVNVGQATALWLRAARGAAGLFLSK